MYGRRGNTQTLEFWWKLLISIFLFFNVIVLYNISTFPPPPHYLPSILVNTKSFTQTNTEKINIDDLEKLMKEKDSIIQSLNDEKNKLESICLLLYEIAVVVVVC